jgi:hypothetical protein
LEGKDDLLRFEALNWELQATDLWEWADCDKRFGDDWFGRLPAQMIAHILYYFSDQNDLVFDAMAGGGVVEDTCLAFGRRCWSFDMFDRPDTRPEIEPYFWDITNLEWPVKSRAKPDLVIFDPPDYKGQSNNDDREGISGLSKEKYLLFLEDFFALAHRSTKKATRLASILSDWRDFEDTPAMDEDPENAIMLHHYLPTLHNSGWRDIDIISAPLSPERFKGKAGAAMQKKKILGSTGRHIIIAKKK